MVGGKTCKLVRSLLTFTEPEELRTIIPGRCERCLPAQELNRKEQEELQMIKQCLTYNKVNKCMNVTYPNVTYSHVSWLKDN